MFVRLLKIFCFQSGNSGHLEQQSPFDWLYSDSSEEEGEIKRVIIVDNKGSHSQCIKVQVQGVPMYRIVDSGADITIIGGQTFHTLKIENLCVRLNLCCKAFALFRLNLSALTPIRLVLVSAMFCYVPCSSTHIASYRLSRWRSYQGIIR